VPDVEPVHEPTENELPVLNSPVPPVPASPPAAAAETNIPAEARDEDGKVPVDIPAWDRDPTFAELRPDLEALERAMAIAHGTDSVAVPEKQPQPAAKENTSAAVEIIPEITLDKQIEAKIQEATEALKKTQLDATEEIRNGDSASNDDDSEEKPAEAQLQPAPAPKPKPTPTAVPAKPQLAANAAPAKETRKPDRELEKIASSIANAKTIEDVDDYMAETLFGEEFSLLAAQVAANASLQSSVETPVVELSLEAEEPKQANTLSTSASQRLKVLRDLNKSTPPKGAPPSPDSAEDIVMSAGGFDTPRSDDAVAVDSIEDQITTSMTQTLKALSIRPNAVSDSDGADHEDDDDDDDSDKGFFSRFRRK
jgi:hypothetical protein